MIYIYVMSEFAYILIRRQFLEEKYFCSVVD